ALGEHVGPGLGRRPRGHARRLRYRHHARHDRAHEQEGGRGRGFLRRAAQDARRWATGSRAACRRPEGAYGSQARTEL
ncbi:hypothetical protein HK101_006313, partial [Irineochytrium annulatum]